MKTRNHKNLIFLLLLIFVGQVVSAPLLSCSKTQTGSHSMSVMDMTSDDMSNMAMSPSSNIQGSLQTMDCCDDDCDCPSGVCASIVLFVSPSTEVNFYNNSSVIIIASQKISKQVLSTIHRPPIFS